MARCPAGAFAYNRSSYRYGIATPACEALGMPLSLLPDLTNYPLTILVIGGLVFVLFLAVKALTQRAAFVHDGRYRKREKLLTPAERSFLGVLDQVVGSDYRVFGQVRMADVLEPDPSLLRKSRQAALNRISRKHFDFILCRPNDLTIVCAIELDDKSHLASHRMERDEFVETACQSAGLPLVRIAAERTYSPTKVAEKIAEALQRPKTAPVVRMTLVS